jgi:hypothetical protein
MYPHIFNFMRASLILATVESLVVTCVNCTTHSFCLPLAHRPILLLHFAWLQATKLFFSAHNILAVLSLALSAAPRTGMDLNMVSGLCIPILILPHGMKHIYWNIYWAMYGCHDLDGTGWRMQMVKRFVKLFNCILLNEWTGNCAAVSECMTVGQKMNSKCLYFGFFVFNPFRSYVGPRPTVWFSSSAPMSEDGRHGFCRVCSPAVRACTTLFLM